MARGLVRPSVLGVGSHNFAILIEQTALHSFDLLLRELLDLFTFLHSSSSFYDRAERHCRCGFAMSNQAVDFRALETWRQRRRQIQHTLLMVLRPRRARDGRQGSVRCASAQLRGTTAFTWDQSGNRQLWIADIVASGQRHASYRGALCLRR